MTTKKATRKPTKRKAAAKKEAAPTRRRRTAAELAGTSVRWGLRLTPGAVAAVDAEADGQVSSGSAVIAGVVEGWAASHPPFHFLAVNYERAPKPVGREETLAAFAGRVVEAASWTRQAGRETTPERRGVKFGLRKVFIRAAYEAMKNGPSYTWERFKERVIEANRARLLSLARADLVEAMHPRDVAESEVAHYGSTFHFIALDSP